VLVRVPAEYIDTAPAERVSPPFGDPAWPEGPDGSIPRTGEGRIADGRSFHRIVDQHARPVPITEILAKAVVDWIHLVGVVRRLIGEDERQRV
jgi:hypothetical protein